MGGKFSAACCVLETSDTQRILPLPCNTPSDNVVMSASAASTADAAVDKAAKSVPAETDDERWTRRLILLSFWTVIILLGLPFWIWTTTVYRAELPSQLMNEWSDGRVWTMRQCFCQC